MDDLKDTLIKKFHSLKKIYIDDIQIKTHKKNIYKFIIKYLETKNIPFKVDIEKKIKKYSCLDFRCGRECCEYCGCEHAPKWLRRLGELNYEDTEYIATLEITYYTISLVQSTIFF